MPLLLEPDAEFLTLNYDALSPENQAKAKEWLGNYKQQQYDKGEPLFPTQEKASIEKKLKLRGMFEAPEKIDYDPGPMSANPALARMQYANMALLSQRYQKEPREVSERYDLLMNDYTRQNFGVGETVDTAKFYALAQKEFQRMKQVEDTSLEGAKAALRGEDVIKSLQAWQAKNLDRMPDSTEFTRGFLQARDSIAGIGVSDAVDAYQRAMQGSPKDGDEETLMDFEGLLLDLPGAKRKAVLTAATMMAQERGEKAVKGIGARESGPMGGAGAAINAITGFFQEIGESGGRFVGKFGGIAKDEELESMANMPALPLITDAAKARHPIASGVAYTSMAKIDSAEKAADFIKEWKVTSFGTVSADVTRADVDEANQTAKRYRELDADEKKLIEAAQKREFKKNQIARELRSIAESSDPVGEISGAIGSSVAMAAANILTRGKTLPISWQLYSEANYDQLRLENPSLEPSKARLISRVSGANEAALDAFEIGILRKLPSVAAVLKSGTGAAWRNAGARLGATFAFEQIQEGAQDLTMPFTRAVFEAVGIDTGLDMASEWERWKNSRGTVAIASIPLILLGAGIATHRDIKDAQNLLSSRDRLGEQGIIEVNAVPILEAARAGKMDEAQTLYREAFTRRSPEVAAEYQAKLETQQKATAEAIVEVTRLGLIPEYTLLPGGKVVVTDLNDGSKATFESWRDAQPVIEQNMNEMERINNDSILRIADDILQKGEEVTVSPRSSDSLATRVRGGFMSPEDAIKAAIAANVIQGVNIDEARKIAADVFGESQEERIKIMRDAVERAIILGSNVVEGGVSKSKLFKGANLATLIEETSEGRLKEGLRLGRYKKSDWLGLIQQAEEATGEKFLIGSTSDAVNASPDFAPRALVEAVSRIVVADVLGRLQDGRRIGSGSITKSLEENNSPLVAWVRAFKRLLASVLQTAKRIREARKTGKLGDEYDAYIDDLLGVDQQAALESEAVAEKVGTEIVQKGIDTSGYSPETPGPNGETFSMSRAVPADASKVVQMPDGAQLVGPTTFSIRAFHGTPHKVDKFSTSKIGTGEGAQAFGWGLYMAESKEVADQYRKKLSGKAMIRSSVNGWEIVNELDGELIGLFQDRAEADAAVEKYNTYLGNLYTVELLPDESEFLDWDKPLSEQSEKVKAAIEKHFAKDDPSFWKAVQAFEAGNQRAMKEAGFNIFDYSGAVGQLYQRMAYLSSDQKASKALAKAGIPGIRYLDAGSRNIGDGTSNFVIFDENLVRILEENGKPVDGETFSLRPVSSVQDAEYMAAVEDDDIEKAQRMVDEAAKAAGYDPSPMYHGSKRTFDEFMVGDNGMIYFADDEDYAKNYGKVVRPFFIKSTNALDLRKWKADADVEGMEFFQALVNAGVSTVGLRSMRGEPLQQLAQRRDDSPTLLAELIQDAGYDGVRIREYYEGGGKAESLAVFNPEQIKSADPVTYHPEGHPKAGKPIALSERFSSADNRITYSLRSGDFASRMEAKFSLFQAKPELRLAIAQVAKERALRLGAEWIAKSDVIRNAKDIGKEQAFREADGFDRRIKAYLDGLSENARQTLEFEPSALDDDPLVSAMLDEGKLMSRNTAVKNGVKNLDEYNGVPWIPPAWYSKGSGITPGKMAKALHDGPQDQGGPLRGDSAQDLWDSLAEVIASTRKDKTAYREAVQAYKDAQKAAKAEAKAEAEAWANQARKIAGSPKAQRDMLKAALRTLDGILAAAPPEVRARVGGYVKLAGLATDEAMLQEIERRIDKLNVELEKYLVKEGRARLERILNKAKPKAEAGEKAKGKLTPEIHAWFTLAEEATKLSPAAADERIEGIANSLSQEMTPAIKEELSRWIGRTISDDAEAQDWQEQRMTILQTFGSVLYGTDAKPARGASDTMAAFDLAKEVYTDGRLAHIEETAKKRERREADRGDGISRVGSPYDANKATQRKKALNKLAGLKGRAADYLDTGLDASGFFLDLLGDGNLYKNTRRNILESDMAKNDAMRKRKAEFAAMLKDVFPKKGLTDRLRGLWELQQIQNDSPVGTLSQLQAMQFTLWWMDMDSREWLESNGYGAEWQAKAEAWLTDEARGVRSWLMKEYAGQYDRINPVFRRLRGVNLPRVDVYGGKRQVEHSKADSSVALETDMMRGGMEAGFTKTRVSRPTGPPKITDALQNYWQNAYQVEHYIAFAETMTELKAVFGHRDFRLAVETNRGQDKAKQVSDWITNLEQAGTRDAFAHSAQGLLFGRYGKAVAASALLFKLSVLAKQAPAAIQSAFKVGLKEYFASLARVMSGKSAISLGEMYQSDTVQRRLSQHDTEMQQAAKGWNQRHFENEIIDKAAMTPDLLMNAGWYAIGWTDARFTTVSAAVAYDVAYRDARRLGSSEEEAKAFAADEAALVVMETAQPQSVATRSLFENQTPMALLRFLFAFQSANRQMFGLTYLALKKGGVANAWGTAALIAGVAQTVGGLIRMMTTDDEPDELFKPEAYALGMATAPLTGMMGLGLIVEAIGNGVGVESRTSVSPATMLASAIKDIAEGDADVKDVSRSMSILGTVLGGRGAVLGVGWNILNQLFGFYKNAAD